MASEQLSFSYVKTEPGGFDCDVFVKVNTHTKELN